MKYTSLRAFERHLDEASPLHFSPLYIILSKDPFQRKSSFLRLLHFLQEKAKVPQLSLKILESDGISPKTLSEELLSPSLFSEKKLVVLHDCDKLPKASIEWLENYFSHPTPHIFLILTASSVHAGTHFYKKMEKYGIILEIVEEKPWEKERSSLEWVQEYFKKANKRIEAQTAQLLVKRVGTDGETLCQEMEKLICYVGTRSEITTQDIAHISVGTPNETIWLLGESLFNLHAPKALSIAHQLLDEGQTLLSLLRQIRTQFQTDLQVCAILAKGGSPADVTALFAYMKGGILERHCQAARQYGLERFKRGLLRIDAAELQAKNSRPERPLFEELIVRLTR